MNANYKTSRYTFTLESNGKYFFYNSLSNVLVEVDKELFDIVARSKEKCETIISYKNYSQCILNLSKSDRVSSYAVYPDYSISECAIRNPYSFSFDPDGYVYKCWEHISDTKYAVGKVDKEGEFMASNVLLMNRQLYGADPLEDSNCRKCSILPICGGGCPIQRIENLFDNGKNVSCSYYKGHVQEFVLEFIRRKEAVTGVVKL